uniref:Uncharacterized protein n=1 Tax=Opuntia streptacantha TaxID=393608 RepID=A0A7C9DM02_OPUST
MESSQKACHPGGRSLESRSKSGCLLSLFIASNDDSATAFCALLRLTRSRQSPPSGWKLAFSLASPLAICCARHSSISRCRFFFRISSGDSRTSSSSSSNSSFAAFHLSTKLETFLLDLSEEATVTFGFFIRTAFA